MNTLASGLLGLAMWAGAPAEDLPTHELRESVAVDSQVQHRVHLVIRGKIQAAKGDETVAGQALLEYGERILKTSEAGEPSQVARFYSDARAKFVVGTAEDARQMRIPVRFVIGDREGQTLRLWSPGGPLAADERELVENTLDTSRLTGLLPVDPVEVGAKWEPNPGVVQALCDLDAFMDSTVVCSLEGIAGNKATINIEGVVRGLSLGTEVKSSIEAKLTFDMERKIVEKLRWVQKDGRAAGPISPAGAFEATLEITRAPAVSRYLSDEVIKSVSTEPAPGGLLLVFDDPGRRFRFYHDRSWHITTLRPNLAVFRRIQDGVLTAQLNVNVLNDRRSGTVMPPDEFQDLIAETGGWTVEKVLKSTELPTDGSFNLRLVTATGTSGELSLLQRHYLATSASGQQLMMTFIIEPDNEQKLGTDDLSMVTSVEFIDAQARKGDKPAR